MKEYKSERLIGLEQMSKQMLENTLNIAAMADWELVCVSDGWAFYVRERKPPQETETDRHA